MVDRNEGWRMITIVDTTALMFKGHIEEYWLNHSSGTFFIRFTDGSVIKLSDRNVTVISGGKE